MYGVIEDMEQFLKKVWDDVYAFLKQADTALYPSKDPGVMISAFFKWRCGCDCKKIESWIFL